MDWLKVFLLIVLNLFLCVRTTMECKANRERWDKQSEEFKQEMREFHKKMLREISESR